MTNENAILKGLFSSLSEDDNILLLTALCEVFIKYSDKDKKIFLSGLKKTLNDLKQTT